MVSLGLLFAFAVLNLRLPGFWLILIGICLNALVIGVNQGMPVTHHALVVSDQSATLGALEHGGGPPLYTVLRFRGDHPDLRSPEMAEQLAAQLGKAMTAVALRQTLHRAREKFATLLLEEVVQSLDNPTPEQLEQELIDLGLLEYCRAALEQRHGTP